MRWRGLRCVCRTCSHQLRMGSQATPGRPTCGLLQCQSLLYYALVLSHCLEHHFQAWLWITVSYPFFQVLPYHIWVWIDFVVINKFLGRNFKIVGIYCSWWLDFWLRSFYEWGDTSRGSDSASDMTLTYWNILQDIRNHTRWCLSHSFPYFQFWPLRFLHPNLPFLLIWKMVHNQQS